jgi:Ca-activated chloride channel homolog
MAALEQIWTKRFCARLVLNTLLRATLCISVPVLTQTSIEDVHIQPRSQVFTSKEPEIAPALKTHAKPFKVDVNMVLVPVTVTDRMNRLVTGLDRENFNLFDGKDQQEIRTFSSEDRLRRWA